MRKALVAGNWKMHGSRSVVAELLDALADGVADMSGGPDMAVLPPFLFVPAAADRLTDTAIAVGAQNVCDQDDEGAFTGEVSARMLKEAGCRYALTGHSERRALYGESDELVAARTAAALRGGIIPIVCLGESLSEREAGETDAVVQRQLRAVVDAVGISGLAGAVLAYEPVWAIGTGRTASPQQAQAVHALLRTYLRKRNAVIGDGMRILYGGSVKPDNAAELFAMPDIDGGLIGGASLNADAFLAICRAAG